MQMPMERERNIEKYLPPGPPAVGSSPINQYMFYRDFQRDPVAKLNSWFDQYGDTVHLLVGEKYHVITTANPEFAHEITVKQVHKFRKGPDYRDEKRGLARFLGRGLLTSDGDFWKRQRKLMQPAFHTQRIVAYADTMVEYAQKMVESWHDGQVLDVDDAMMRLTLLIVAKSLFNVDASETAHTVGEALDIFQKMMNEPDMLPLWLPTPGHIRQRKALEAMDAVVYGFMEEWRKQGEDRGDLLSMLMLAEDDDGHGMSSEQVRDEAVTLLLAGHETTANSMNWTWYLLSQNPDVEAKLHEELDRVLDGRTPTLDDLKNLPYTDMVVKESMRLYPPAWSIGRQAIEEVQLGDYTIPAWTDVNIVMQRMHRDPRWWDDPEAFKPERFSPENEASINKLAYMPFGGGQRICIGNSFASMEARLLLATIAQHYKLRLTEGETVRMHPQITLRPRGGLRMRLVAR